MDIIIPVYVINISILVFDHCIFVMHRLEQFLNPRQNYAIMASELRSGTYGNLCPVTCLLQT